MKRNIEKFFLLVNLKRDIFYCLMAVRVSLAPLATIVCCLSLGLCRCLSRICAVACACHRRSQHSRTTMLVMKMDQYIPIFPFNKKLF